MFKFDKYSAKKWTHIIIHHSWSPDNGNINNWDEIARYHVQEKGWNSIGYHLGIEKNIISKPEDKFYESEYIYCIGRGLDCVGAHTLGMNDKAIGIVLIGNYDIAEPEQNQYEMIAELCKDLMRDFNIPIENIQRHSQYADKSCPGLKFDTEKLYSHIRGG